VFLLKKKRMAWDFIACIDGDRRCIWNTPIGIQFLPVHKSLVISCWACSCQSTCFLLTMVEHIPASTQVSQHLWLNVFLQVHKFIVIVSWAYSWQYTCFQFCLFEQNPASTQVFNYLWLSIFLPVRNSLVIYSINKRIPTSRIFPSYLCLWTTLPKTIL